MSYFGATDPNVNSTVPPRPPGGFQYDPRTDSWSNFFIDDDYYWTDLSSSFALFQRPNSPTLFQANIGDNTIVNLGMLKNHSFANVASWSLNPAIHGYPIKLVYGNNSIYQFGTQVDNNRTGALRYTITRIPLPSNPTTIDHFDQGLQVYQAPAMGNCTQGYISSSYYKDTLYVFCQGLDSDMEAGIGLVMTLTQNDAALDDAYETYIRRLSGAIIQPFDFLHSREAFVVNTPDDLTIQLVSLEPSDIGWTTAVSYYINITDPYGFPVRNQSSHVGAIVGGAVGGAIFIAIVVFCVIAWLRWPRWRRKLREKVLKMTNDDDENHGDNALRTAKGNNDKIEESPSDEIDTSGKILVTDDRELDDVMDVNTVYMKDIRFENHPKPGVVTSMNDTSSFHSGENGRAAHSEEMGSNSHTLRDSISTSASTASTTTNISREQTVEPKLPPIERLTHTPSAPYIYNLSPDGARPLKTTSSLPDVRQPQQQPVDVPGFDNTNFERSKEWTMESSQDDLTMDIAPPYSQDLYLSHLQTPSFPIPPTPTAPIFFSDAAEVPSTSTTTDSEAIAITENNQMSNSNETEPIYSPSIEQEDELERNNASRLSLRAS
ncbi:hypothetical protein BGZ76_003276 [Entomortierella beljakovae]|nr:hypothetical protein BGZ76_003276 [Entomortierella beljakovae]